MMAVPLVWKDRQDFTLSMLACFTCPKGDILDTEGDANLKHTSLRKEGTKPVQKGQSWVEINYCLFKRVFNDFTQHPDLRVPDMDGR